MPDTEHAEESDRFLATFYHFHGAQSQPKSFNQQENFFNNRNSYYKLTILR